MVAALYEGVPQGFEEMPKLPDTGGHAPPGMKRFHGNLSRADDHNGDETLKVNCRIS